MSWEQVMELIVSILTTQSGLPNLMFKQVIMIGVAFFFLYLAVAKRYEPPAAGAHRLRHLPGQLSPGAPDGVQRARNPPS